MPRAAVKFPSDAPPVEASSRSNPSSAASACASLKEADGSTQALHGRAVDAAGEFKRAALVLWLEGGEFALDARAVGLAGDAHVDFSPGMGGNDIHFGAAAGHAHADSEAALQVGPTADGLNDGGQLKKRVGAFLEVDACMSGDSADANTPVAGTLARCFQGESLGGLKDEDGSALLRELFSDGAGDGAADFLVGIEQENDFFLERASFGEHFEGGEGHGDAGFHVESSGTVETAAGQHAGHGLESAEGPDGVEMAEEKDAVFGVGRFGSEAGFEHVAEGALPVKLDAATQGA